MLLVGLGLSLVQWQKLEALPGLATVFLLLDLFGNSQRRSQRQTPQQSGPFSLPLPPNDPLAAIIPGKFKGNVNTCVLVLLDDTWLLPASMATVDAVRTVVNCRV